MKKSIILAMVISFMLISLTAPVAFAGKAKTSTGPVTVQGTLEQSDTGFVVKSGKSTHVVTGEGLSSFVGKKVVASGKFVTTDKGKVLQIEKIAEDISKKK